MQGIDRRMMLRDVLCGAAAATVGIALMAVEGEATPLALEKSPAGKADDLIEGKADDLIEGKGDDLIEEVGWRGRRRRRWVCWRNRWGRRTCGWRW